MNQMRVVFPLIGLPKSGGIRVLVELVNGLVERGHQVHVLLTRPSKDSTFPLDEKVDVKRSSAEKSVLEELWWLVRNAPRDADAVVASYYLTAYPTAIVTSLYRQKGYYYVQGYEPDFFVFGRDRKVPLVQRMLAWISYHLPLYQVTTSAWLQGVLRNMTGQDAVVVNVGVNTAVFFPRFIAREQKNIRTIMCLGKKDPNKGFAYFLEAISILDRQFPDLRLLIATQDRELVVNTSIPAKVVHPADDEELARYYGQADVFVFPSLQEGFGLPPLEAMACGTPVVTTDCGGVSDFAEDGVNCLIVPVKDPQAMAEAMRRMLDDRDLAERLSKAGRKTACRFTWDVMVDKFESLLINTLVG